MTWFFKQKYDLQEGFLGSLFFVTSIIAACSMLVASSIAKRFGNIKVRDPFFCIPLGHPELERSITNDLPPSDNGVHSSSIRNLSGLDPNPEQRPFLNAFLDPSLLLSEYGRGPTQRLPCSRYSPQ